MYSKEESARLRQRFWISFGQYMKPVPSAEGSPINWINYKTGVKNIFFKMDADGEQGIVAIELRHTDEGIRHLIFNQFDEFKVLFNGVVKEEWLWERDTVDAYGRPLSKIYIVLKNKNILNPQHWPELISFFKTKIMCIDEFWTDVKPVFEDLV